MFSYQVHDLDEFEHYLRGWVDSFGADVAPANGPSFHDVTDSQTGAIFGVDVEQFRLRFSTGTSLTVDLFVAARTEAPPEVTRYSFHFQTAERMLWRFCRNDHYERTDGTQFHLHRADGRREAHPPSELSADLREGHPGERCSEQQVDKAVTARLMMTPAYDALHTWPYEQDHRFSPAIRPEGAHDAVTARHWLLLAADLGLPERAARRLIARVRHGVTAILPRLATETDLPDRLVRDAPCPIRRRLRDLDGG